MQCQKWIDGAAQCTREASHSVTPSAAIVARAVSVGAMLQTAEGLTRHVCGLHVRPFRALERKGEATITERVRYFGQLQIGQTFDFLGSEGYDDRRPAYGHSFYDACKKVSARMYVTNGGLRCQIGSVTARVYHVGKPWPLSRHCPECASEATHVDARTDGVCTVCEACGLVFSPAWRSDGAPYVAGVHSSYGLAS